MWILKLQLNHSDCPVVERCKKFNTIILSYPLAANKVGKATLATTTCFFEQGSEKDKREFLKDLKNDRRVTNYEEAGNSFTYEIRLDEKGKHVMLDWNKEIAFIKPTINHFDGYEYWEVSSWKRETLEKFVKELERKMDFCKILKFEKSVLSDVYFPKLMPQLSKQQKEALELALANGYYDYPHKITLKELADIQKISLSTFQEHLRKAEGKVMPGLIPK